MVHVLGEDRLVVEPEGGQVGHDKGNRVVDDQDGVQKVMHEHEDNRVDQGRDKAKEHVDP